MAADYQPTLRSHPRIKPSDMSAFAVCATDHVARVVWHVMKVHISEAQRSYPRTCTQSQI